MKQENSTFPQRVVSYLYSRNMKYNHTKSRNFMHNHLKSLRILLYNRINSNKSTEKEVVDNFHKLYYNASNFGKSWSTTSFMGIPLLKCPLDLWVYQQIIYEVKPDIIIETGTSEGGSALFLASVCDLFQKGRVITVDIRDNKQEQNKKRVLNHPRITYLIGSSTSAEVEQTIKSQVKKGDKVLVVLDALHDESHVSKEIELYSPLVTQHSYLIVEDTNFNGNPVDVEFTPGPMEAVQKFMKNNNDFMVDKEREAHFMTFNPSGYLKRLTPSALEK